MSNLAVHVLSGPKLTSAPISLRSRRDCLSWKKELIGATVFMGTTSSAILIKLLVKLEKYANTNTNTSLTILNS